jgi:hypothetical protein
MSDFTIFYKRQLPLQHDWPQSWDTFVSAYNSSERVTRVFEKVRASRKIWVVLPQYQYASNELPTGDVFVSSHENEADFISAWSDAAALDFTSIKLCLDLTGFIRPNLLFLIKFLKEKGVTKFDALYSEPISYKKKELTEFSSGRPGDVRQVAGFEGIHSTIATNDILIIGSGYDHEAIARVAYNKDAARKIQLLGLPSLRADMYQENELKVAVAEDAVGQGITYFAPAYDPFVTAQVLDEIIADIARHKPISNLYLSPLASKPQVLGFALYYLCKLHGTAASVIYPTTPHYSRETTIGLSRVWQYTVEF